MRSQQEILKRIEAVKDDDMLGFAREVLIDSLDYEHAKPFLNPETTEAEWNSRVEGVLGGVEQVGSLMTDDRIRQAAVDYLNFAWGKAEDRRGISAGRSVQKLTEYVWLLGLDTKPVDEADYAQYGAPKLKVVAELLGQPIPTSPSLVAMMDGRLLYED